MSDKNKNSTVLAAVIAAVFVGALILLARCPSELPPPPSALPGTEAAAADSTSTDSTARKGRKKKKAQEPKLPRTPRARDFLDEPVD